MKIVNMEDKRCGYCGRTENLEYQFTEWPETIHNGGGPGTYQVWHELEGWFCKGDDEDESCWDKKLKETDDD